MLYLTSVISSVSKRNSRVLYKNTVVKSKKDDIALSICYISDTFIIQSLKAREGGFQIVSGTPNILYILVCKCEQLHA